MSITETLHQIAVMSAISADVSYDIAYVFRLEEFVRDAEACGFASTVKALESSYQYNIDKLSAQLGPQEQAA